MVGSILYIARIRDALAYLRLILNPFDIGAMHRILLRPSRGIGEATIRSVIESGQTCGFRLTDMASNQTLVNGDPFSNLLAAYTTGTIVIFDVETTGLDINKDEVVEIAAAKLVNGKLEREFRACISNLVPVGDSQHVHGYSDEFLAANGRPAFDVFSEFFVFSRGASEDIQKL